MIEALGTPLGALGEALGLSFLTISELLKKLGARVQVLTPLPICLPFSREGDLIALLVIPTKCSMSTVK